MSTNSQHFVRDKINIEKIATTVFKFEKISNYMTKNVGKNRKLNTRTLLQYCRKNLREFIIHSTVTFAVYTKMGFGAIENVHSK